jgi:noranthrone synthase
MNLTIAYFSCVLTLGSHHEEAGVPFPSPAETYILGLCTGSLAAVAASCSKSLSDLLPMAVQAVRVSFRAGVTTVRARDEMTITDEERKEEWSAVFFKLDIVAATAAIRDFSTSKVCHQSLTFFDTFKISG